MPVSYTALDPSKLRAGWTTNGGVDLKSSCVTDKYTGGTPSDAAHVKRSIVDVNGNVKKGMTTPDDTALKASVLKAGAENPEDWDSRVFTASSHYALDFNVDPLGGVIETWIQYTASDIGTGSRYMCGVTGGGNTRLFLETSANSGLLRAGCGSLSTSVLNHPALTDEIVNLKLDYDNGVVKYFVNGEQQNVSENYSDQPYAGRMALGGLNNNTNMITSARWSGTMYRFKYTNSSGSLLWDTEVDGWGTLNGSLAPVV